MLEIFERKGKFLTWKTAPQKNAHSYSQPNFTHRLITKLLIYRDKVKEKAVSEAVGEIKSCEQFRFNEKSVIESLEQAGRALLALRVGGYHTGLAQRHLEVLPERFPGYVREAMPVRIAAPSQQQIREMDEVLAWVLIIPVGDAVMRRIVNARCLRHPVTDQYLYGWRKIADMVGKDHKFVQRRHEQGIKIIVNGLEKLFLGIAQTPQHRI